MGNFIDIPNGTRFGHLTVLEYSDVRTSDGKRQWKCQCDCGKICYVLGSYLRSGRRTTCGCRIGAGEDRKLNLIGQRYGFLIVLEEAKEEKRKQVMWKCICDCGNETIVSTENLRSGNTKSCGCWGRTSSFRGRWKDLRGQKFGKLTPIHYIKGNEESNGRWECKCDCGNLIQVQSYSLTSGNTLSCGCIQSKGEYSITQLLNENNIPYETQKKFDSCVFPDTKQHARFDFYIDDRYLIEYDGAQHFKTSGWTSEEDLKKNQWRDNFKNQWCKENNIPLIRIPYTHLDKLTLNDLILEWSDYVWQPDEEIQLNKQ